MPNNVWLKLLRLSTLESNTNGISTFRLSLKLDYIFKFYQLLCTQIITTIGRTYVYFNTSNGINKHVLPITLPK